jgi:hypothetical protein
MVSGDVTTCMTYISGKYRLHKDLCYLGGITRTAEGSETWRYIQTQEALHKQRTPPPDHVVKRLYRFCTVL